VRFRRRFVRTRDGGYRVHLPASERELLRAVAGELRFMLTEHQGDPSLRRLFPPAHEDPEREEEYRGLVRDQLLTGRQRALATLDETVDRETLTSEEAEAWLTVLNDARLVLGTRVDVTEETDFGAVDPEDPEAQELAVYAYLTWLQGELVEAVADRP
jgi:Domain of unknown function (DUF2017)